MAKGSTAPARTEVMEVTDSNQALALAAAWRGAYHFFGARVDNWEITPPTSENPEGGLIAHGFSVYANLDPNQILTDLARRDRRVPFLPTYHYLTGNVVPEDFTDPQDMTNFSVSFLKGSAEDGTSKTPAYVRDQIATYKAAHGLATRRGPRRKIIRLDNLDSIDASTIASIDPDQLEAFLKLAQKVASEKAAIPAAETVSAS